MTRPFGLLIFTAALLLPCMGRARPSLGTVVATFDYTASKVLADPVRPRIYITDTATNALVVIDTTNLQVAATIPIGSDPVDMAISSDDNTLYVANHGSTLAAIAVVDLNALSVRANFALPNEPQTVAVGAGGRVYASAYDTFNSIVYQLDGTTGAVQTTFDSDIFNYDFLQVSPDGRTLFAAGFAGSPSTLRSFDISTATPAALQENTEAGENAIQLVVSHNGRYVCLPSGGGNVPRGGYSTYLFSAADISAHYGSYGNGDYPGPLAFSPDDALVYQSVGDGGYAQGDALQVFNTASFALVDTVSFPKLDKSGYGDTITSIVTDHTGSYLVIGVSAMEDGSYPFRYVGQVLILSTGVSDPAPPPPVAAIVAATPAVASGTGQTGVFTLKLSSAPPVDVHVAYAVKGSAVNGQDYVLLRGEVKVGAGKKHKVIKIVPQGDLGGVAKKTVVLKLLPSVGYTVGTANKAKVKILATTQTGAP